MLTQQSIVWSRCITSGPVHRGDVRSSSLEDVQGLCVWMGVQVVRGHLFKSTTRGRQNTQTFHSAVAGPTTMSHWGGDQTWDDLPEVRGHIRRDNLHRCARALSQYNWRERKDGVLRGWNVGLHSLVPDLYSHFAASETAGGGKCQTNREGACIHVLKRPPPVH